MFNISGFTLDANVKFANANAAIQTALAAGQYPASGDFVNVAEFETFFVLVALGGIADAVVFTLQAADAVDGTPVEIDDTKVKKTIAATDDGQLLLFQVETRNLPSAQHSFVSLNVAGITGANYAAILFLMPSNFPPVTQADTVLPADNVLTLMG
ncbi:MAG: hypothetical protein FOGNACKC_00910 [Anaerolineae bacterium]|nr:hypothetical protein [Anaerolineae bacterium]